MRNELWVVIGFAKLWCWYTRVIAVNWNAFQEFDMAESVLRTRAKEFAKDIVFLCRKLKQNGAESVLVNQLLWCGTSVGANVYEAQYAQGTKDFISKFEIALKECNESEYWLELLYETNTMTQHEFEGFQSRCIELRRMLVSSVTTLKSR